MKISYSTMIKSKNLKGHYLKNLNVDPIILSAHCKHLPISISEAKFQNFGNTIFFYLPHPIIFNTQ